MLTQKRNYGIDLLRIVSMIMVVILHVIMAGCFLDTLPNSSFKYGLVWFLEIASGCAVNCYALISGYTGHGRKHKSSGIISLWFQVAFYTIGISVLFKLISPETVSTSRLVSSFFPVSFDTYWYFTSYFALFFFIPFLNHLIDTLSKRSAATLILTCVLLFSIFSPLAKGDIFLLKTGYSFLWLAVLYLTGAFVKKYQFGFNLKKRIWLIIYFICVIITLLVKLLVPILSKRIGFLASFENMLIDYISPTMLLCAVSLLIFFANLNLRNTFCKLIAFFSTCTFAVYIIHINPTVWVEVMRNRFVAYADFNIVLLALAIIGTAIAIWLVCSLVDKVRQLLFKLIRIDVLAAKIANLVQKIVDKIVNGLQKLMI